MSVTLPAITALGTRWLVEVFDEDIDTTHIHADLVSYIDNYEKRYSRFLRSSLVSELNHTGVLENPDQDCLDILRYGQALYDKTNGSFNILVGAELSARGYNSAYTFTPEQPNSTQIIPSPLTDLHIEETCITLTAGGIDLGGFGKGYLIDLVAERLKNVHQLPYFLINAGGDMFATSDHGSALDIYFEHPLDAETYIYTTSIKDQGFAASSAKKRSWRYQGVTHTHLVATTSRIDNDHTVGSYVIARSATSADVLATTSLLSLQIPSEYLKDEQANVARFDTRSNQLTSSAPLPGPVLQS